MSDGNGLRGDSISSDLGMELDLADEELSGALVIPHDPARFGWTPYRNAFLSPVGILSVLAILIAAVGLSLGPRSWHWIRGVTGQTDEIYTAAPKRGFQFAVPVVEPLIVRALPVEKAREINAAVPFSTLPNPAAAAFRVAGDEPSRQRAIDCLASAGYYESGDDDKGQRAVMQVVLNRARHPAFPKSICGVVFQGSERVTGCQFTFTCDGALGRTPSDVAWSRARARAAEAIAGFVFSAVGHATHYHTDWVVPYWSASLDKIVAIDTHLFFRWQGRWGRPVAFNGRYAGNEPAVAAIARLSPAHLAALAGGMVIAESPVAPIEPLAPPPEVAAVATPAQPLATGRLLAAEARSNDAYVVQLDAGAFPGSYAIDAAGLCGGKSFCKVLGWTGGKGGSVADLDFLYIRDNRRREQKALWNCSRLPRSNPAQCLPGSAAEVEALAATRPMAAARP